jgi:hypothetical protein
MNKVEKRGAYRIPPQQVSMEECFDRTYIGVQQDRTVCFIHTETTSRGLQKLMHKKEKVLRTTKIMDEEDVMIGILEDSGEGWSVDNLIRVIERGDAEIEIARELHEPLWQMVHEVRCNTKYKTVDKKVRPAAVPLPLDAADLLQRTQGEPRLRKVEDIGHTFTRETLEQLTIGGDGLLTEVERNAFKEMISKYGKAFAFKIEEIGCVNPAEVTPMIMFTVPHVPWDLKPIPVPKALLPHLVELLKEKVRARILEPSGAPYSNRWFTIRKKNGKLRFIQDMQPPNGVTIKNAGTGPVVDEFAEEFAGRAVYSIGDLYSGYDQFQLAEASRDITTMRTPLGLMRMCTLPMGATNSVAHMQSAMNRILQQFIPEKTRPFLDDIPIKGCALADRDETLTTGGIRKFIWDHIQDVEAILQRLIEAGVTLSGEKSAFGLQEIVVVGHLCGPYGRKPNHDKVEVIGKIKDCTSVPEVRRFLGACVFYRIWIPHFAHVAEPLYQLLRKKVTFGWSRKHSLAMKRLKLALQNSPVLRPLDYTCGRPIIVTVDASPYAARWAVGQDDAEGSRYAARFGARIFTERQRRYPQIKRELWGAKIALKQDRICLIGAHIIIETDCMPLLGMIANCDTPDIAMLRWIAFIRMFNPELRHIAGKDNPVADMLSRARYDESTEDDCSVAAQEINVDSWFKEELYTGDLLIIGKYLSTLERDPNWTSEEFARVRRKSYGFQLKEGFLWRLPKILDGVPLRVVGDDNTKKKILEELHDAEAAGHRGVQGTYDRIRGLYWWAGMYTDVRLYVETCKTCQVYSKVRHRDGLKPTYPLCLHFQWVLDLVHMPSGVRGAKYLVLAREDLSNYVEGRALTSTHTEQVCRFILEDIVSRYGCFYRMRADRKELDAEEAVAFFAKFNIKLNLTTAYNPEANGKSERGHPPIVNALVKACKGRTHWWPDLLPLALMADRLTCSSVTGLPPAELMSGHLPIMPVEEDVTSWRTIEWSDQISTEELIERRIEHFNLNPERVKIAREKVKAARLKNKARFDKTHRLRPVPIKEGDWVLISDNSLDMQHSALKKFAQRFHGPYVVTKVHDNATYTVRELDGAEHRIPYAGKRVKLFKQRMELIVDGNLHEDLEDVYDTNDGADQI